VRVLAYIKKLDDCFGQLRLTMSMVSRRPYLECAGERQLIGEGSPMVRLLILLTSAALGLAGCAIFKRTDPPQVTVMGVEPAASGASQGLGAHMQLRLRVKNPNDTPIEYNGISVELEVQNKSLASGMSNESGTVPAFGETAVLVPVEISYMGMAGQAMGLLSGKSLDKVTYEMHGKVGTVPFKSQGELSLTAIMTGGK
jgi:LEA14-like dessication related protein